MFEQQLKTNVLGQSKVTNCVGIFLSQHKYIWDLLQMFDLNNAKSTTTPMETNVKLQLNDSIGMVGATTCKKLVGCLQYLSLNLILLTLSINCFNSC